MDRSQVAVQMYTLREHLKSVPEIVRTCERVKQMGYDLIETASFGDIAIGELAKILRDVGLRAIATHVPFELLKDSTACVDHHGQLECEYAVVPSYWPAKPSTGAFETFAAELSDVARALAPHGLRVGYHNHSRELAMLDGPKRILDILIDGTGSEVWFEIDTYWIAHGGGDPAAWIDKVRGRIPCVHVKDMDITTDQQQKMCEVAAGNLNWSRILDACRRSGVEYYIVERDHGDLDPFESLKVSLENLVGRSDEAT